MYFTCTNWYDIVDLWIFESLSKRTLGYVHSLHASALFGWRTQSMVERLTLVSPSAMSLMTLCRNSRSRPALFWIVRSAMRASWACWENIAILPHSWGSHEGHSFVSICFECCMIWTSICCLLPKWCTESRKWCKLSMTKILSEETINVFVSQEGPQRICLNQTVSDSSSSFSQCQSTSLLLVSLFLILFFRFLICFSDHFLPLLKSIHTTQTCAFWVLHLVVWIL